MMQPSVLIPPDETLQIVLLVTHRVSANWLLFRCFVD